MTFCDFFAEFAGPVATIVAAFTAAGITIYFGFWQARIAEAQKSIAHDKLKHDLFADRYKIYQAARSLLKCAMKHDYERLPSQEVVELRIKLDEARFFFPKDIVTLVNEIDSACEDHMVQIDRRKIQNPDDDPVAWRASGDALAEGKATLQNLYNNLSQRFERDLGFEQLTRDPGRALSG
jgi:hypothetical protein